MGGCVTWTVAKGELITTEIKQGIEVNDWCCMFKFDGESVDHLFLYCVTARDLWSIEYFSMFFLWSVGLCQSSSLNFGMLRRIFKKNFNAATWKVIPLCLMWSSWWERNACMSEAKKKERTLGNKVEVIVLPSLY